jgi:hypothetical protein
MRKGFDRLSEQSNFMFYNTFFNRKGYRKALL